METAPSFEVIIRKKLPVFSNLLRALAYGFFLVLAVFYLFMLPAKYLPNEMKAAYFIEIVPDLLKKMAAFSAVAFAVTSILYFKIRLKKDALLTFHSDRISIVGNETAIFIPNRKIEKIFCNDLKNRARMPKEVLQLVIKEKRRKTTTLVLKDYEQGGALIDTIARLKNIKLGSYEDSMLPD